MGDVIREKKQTVEMISVNAGKKKTQINLCAADECCDLRTSKRNRDGG
jgi:hypothetical protein